jgi:catechol-2,3-dioxygenase
VGLYASDPEALAEFYQAVLGLQVIGLSDLNAEGVRHSIFLSVYPDADHHQLAIFANPEHQYTAFQRASLADLRTLYQRIVERGLPIRWVLNHGVSLAFYFSDPAGNLIKIYWPTGVAYPQPHGHPIDLNQSEAALRQDVANLMAQFKLSEEGNSGLA